MKLFYIDINLNDDVTGMDAISFVDHPAVERNFILFEKQEPIALKFDNSEHCVTGVVCLADTPIYRFDAQMGEYYVEFTKETVKKLMLKYAKMNLHNSVNLQHNDNRFVSDVYMVESYIKDSTRGVVPAEFADVPDGSWIATYKVMNEELWSDIVTTNQFNGFSLQGMFDLTPNNPDNIKMSKIINENDMKLLTKIAKMLFASIATDKGELTYEGELAEGVEVLVEVEGELVPAEDGEYIAEDKKITVADGKVAAIEEVEAQPENQPEEQPKEENQEEQEPENQPEPANDEVEELKKQLEEKDAKIAELEAKIAELENKNKEQEEQLKMSADKPAKDKVGKSQKSTFKSYL